MTLKEFALAIDKIHNLFYGEKTNDILEPFPNVIKLNYSNDYIQVDNAILETNFKLTFPEYEGKIDEYNYLFGEILKNSDNTCDTGYFIDLTSSFANKIYEYITNEPNDKILRYKLFNK